MRLRALELGHLEETCQYTEGTRKIGSGSTRYAYRSVERMRECFIFSASDHTGTASVERPHQRFSPFSLLPNLPDSSFRMRVLCAVLVSFAVGLTAEPLSFASLLTSHGAHDAVASFRRARAVRAEPSTTAVETAEWVRADATVIRWRGSPDVGAGARAARIESVDVKLPDGRLLVAHAASASLIPEGSAVPLQGVLHDGIFYADVDAHECASATAPGGPLLCTVGGAAPAAFRDERAAADAARAARRAAHRALRASLRLPSVDDASDARDEATADVSAAAGARSLQMGATRNSSLFHFPLLQGRARRILHVRVAFMEPLEPGLHNVSEEIFAQNVASVRDLHERRSFGSTVYNATATTACVYNITTLTTIYNVQATAILDSVFNAIVEGSVRHGTPSKCAISRADIDAFDHVAVYFPRPATGDGSRSQFCGIGAMNGKWVLMNGQKCLVVERGILSHELGHNFGLSHASTYVRNRAPTVDSYGAPLDSFTEYGDITSNMAVGATNELSAAHKHAAGWIPDDRVVNIDRLRGVGTREGVVTSGLFWLAAVDRESDRGDRAGALDLPPGVALTGRVRMGWTDLFNSLEMLLDGRFYAYLTYRGKKELLNENECLLAGDNSDPTLFSSRKVDFDASGVYIHFMRFFDKAAGQTIAHCYLDRQCSVFYPIRPYDATVVDSGVVRFLVEVGAVKRVRAGSASTADTDSAVLVRMLPLDDHGLPFDGSAPLGCTPAGCAVIPTVTAVPPLSTPQRFSRNFSAMTPTAVFSITVTDDSVINVTTCGDTTYATPIGLSAFFGAFPVAHAYYGGNVGVTGHVNSPGRVDPAQYGGTCFAINFATAAGTTVYVVAGSPGDLRGSRVDNATVEFSVIKSRSAKATIDQFIRVPRFNSADLTPHPLRRASQSVSDSCLYCSGLPIYVSDQCRNGMQWTFSFSNYSGHLKSMNLNPLTNTGLWIMSKVSPFENLTILGLDDDGARFLMTPYTTDFPDEKWTAETPLSSFLTGACPAGSFMNGRACDLCPVKNQISNVAATSAADCYCPEDWQLNAAGTACEGPQPGGPSATSAGCPPNYSMNATTHKCDPCSLGLFGLDCLEMRTFPFIEVIDTVPSVLLGITREAGGVTVTQTNDPCLVGIFRAAGYGAAGGNRYQLPYYIPADLENYVACGPGDPDLGPIRRTRSDDYWSVGYFGYAIDVADLGDGDKYRWGATPFTNRSFTARESNAPVYTDLPDYATSLKTVRPGIPLITSATVIFCGLGDTTNDVFGQRLCYCGPGLYASAVGVCVKCAGGTYRAIGGSLSKVEVCTACPSGKVSAPGADSCADSCPSGYSLTAQTCTAPTTTTTPSTTTPSTTGGGGVVCGVGAAPDVKGTMCVSCGAGFAGDGVTCTLCPLFSVAIASGGACVCPPGYIQTGGACQPPLNFSLTSAGINDAFTLTRLQYVPLAAPLAGVLSGATAGARVWRASPVYTGAATGAVFFWAFGGAWGRANSTGLSSSAIAFGAPTSTLPTLLAGTNWALDPAPAALYTLDATSPPASLTSPLPTTPLTGGPLPSTFGAAPATSDAPPLATKSMFLYSAAQLRSFPATDVTFTAGTTSGVPKISVAGSAFGTVATGSPLTLTLKGAVGTGDRVALIPISSSCASVVDATPTVATLTTDSAIVSLSAALTAAFPETPPCTTTQTAWTVCVATHPTVWSSASPSTKATFVQVVDAAGANVAVTAGACVGQAIATKTATASATGSATGSAAPATATATASATGSATARSTGSATATASATATRVDASMTATASATASATGSRSARPTGSATATASATAMPTASGSATASATASASFAHCAAGLFRAGKESACTVCPAGTFSSTGSTSCTACESGYSSAAGASSCTVTATATGTFALSSLPASAFSGGSLTTSAVGNLTVALSSAITAAAGANVSVAITKVTETSTGTLLYSASRRRRLPSYGALTIAYSVSGTSTAIAAATGVSTAALQTQISTAVSSISGYAAVAATVTTALVATSVSAESGLSSSSSNSAFAGSVVGIIFGCTVAVLIAFSCCRHCRRRVLVARLKETNAGVALRQVASEGAAVDAANKGERGHRYQIA